MFNGIKILCLFWMPTHHLVACYVPNFKIWINIYTIWKDWSRPHEEAAVAANNELFLMFRAEIQHDPKN